VTSRVTGVGRDEDLTLAAPGGAQSVETISAGAAPPPEGGATVELVVALGWAPAPAGDHAVIRWLDGAAPSSSGGAAGKPPGPATERTIAQGGQGLWRRAPWPVADPLFDMPAPAAGAGMLVLGGPSQRREQVLSILAERGVPARSADALTPSALASAAAVVLLAAPDEPLPAWLMAPLAAGRVLVLAGRAGDFGLQAGIDHLVAAENDEVAALAEVVATQSRAFQGMRAFARLSAERHRAATVYERLLTDVRLERESRRVSRA
jgi:hypothetical protein